MQSLILPEGRGASELQYCCRVGKGGGANGVCETREGALGYTVGGVRGEVQQCLRESCPQLFPHILQGTSFLGRCSETTRAANRLEFIFNEAAGSSEVEWY